MRKQTGFSFRQYRVSGVDPTAHRLLMEQSIQEEYLSKGWEVLSSSVTKVDANDVYVAVSFVRYEDIAEAKAK